MKTCTNIIILYDLSICTKPNKCLFFCTFQTCKLLTGQCLRIPFAVLIVHKSSRDVIRFCRWWQGNADVWNFYSFILDFTCETVCIVYEIKMLWIIGLVLSEFYETKSFIAVFIFLLSVNSGLWSVKTKIKLIIAIYILFIYIIYILFAIYFYLLYTKYLADCWF